MKTKTIGQLMSAAGILALASCGEKQSPPANVEVEAKPDAITETAAVPAPPDPQPPQKPEGPAYPPEVMAELEKLKEKYPEVAVDVDSELARLKDYEHAEMIFQSDLPVIAKEYVDLMSCSPEGTVAYFDGAFLARMDPKKLIMIRFAKDRTSRIVNALQQTPAKLSPEAMQAAYDRILLLEQASKRLTVLKYACFFRHLIMVPRFQEAVRIASETGNLAQIRALSRILELITQEEGALSYYSSDHGNTVEIIRAGEPSIAKQLNMDSNATFRIEDGMAFELNRRRLEFYKTLISRFQKDEITLLDVGMIGAMEKSIRHGLKTTELKHAALSMAGTALQNWLPETWESIGSDGGASQSQMDEKPWQLLWRLEKLSGIPLAISTQPTPEEKERARNPYSPYGAQPKSKVPQIEAVIYMNNRAYKGSEFTKLILKHPIRNDIISIINQGNAARGIYESDWTLDSDSENGKLKPMPVWSPSSEQGK